MSIIHQDSLNAPVISKFHIQAAHSFQANITVFYAREDNGLVPSRKIILLIDNAVCRPLAMARSYFRLAKQLLI